MTPVCVCGAPLPDIRRWCYTCARPNPRASELPVPHEWDDGAKCAKLPKARQGPGTGQEPTLRSLQEQINALDAKYDEMTDDLSTRIEELEHALELTRDALAPFSVHPVHKRHRRRKAVRRLYKSAKRKRKK